MRRYDIKAKRKDKKEPWTAWTSTYDFDTAVKHYENVRMIGYDAKIVEVIPPIKILRDFVTELRGKAAINVQEPYVTVDTINQLLLEYEEKRDERI